MDNELIKSNRDVAGNRRKIGSALALVGVRPAVPVPGDTCELSFFCAVHDKPYRLRFIRQDSGLFHCVESLKLQPANACRGETQKGGGLESLRVEEFDDESTPCPWCGAGGFYYCQNNCGALVCGGLSRGNSFRCRASCGAEWVGVPLEEVQAVTNPHESERFQAPPRPSRPSDTKPVALLLGTVKPAGRYDLVRPDVKGKKP